jgi:hypothetical protein
MATTSKMQLIDPPSPFAPMKDLQAFLQRHEGEPDKTPAMERELRFVRESIARREAQDQASRTKPSRD